MTVNFGDIRSAIHSGGELPEGWMEDERAREYVAVHVREVGLDAYLVGSDIELMCGGALVGVLTRDEAYAAMNSARSLVVLLAWHQARLPLGHTKDQVFNAVDWAAALSAEQACGLLTTRRERLQFDPLFTALPEHMRELILAMLQDDPYSAIRLTSARLISTPSMADHAMMHIARECADRITKGWRPAWADSLEQQLSLIHARP